MSETLKNTTQFFEHAISQSEITIGSFIVVEDRMCKISTCECNSKSKRMYIKCCDVETNKPYAIYVSESLFFLENFKEGDCSTIVDNSLTHIATYDYNFRNQDEYDQLDTHNSDNITLYSVGHSNVIIGCYLQHGTNYYVISGYNVVGNNVLFKCKHMYTKQEVFHEVIPTPESNKSFKESNLLEFGTTVINTEQNGYICCYDEKNNSVGFIFDLN